MPEDPHFVKQGDTVRRFRRRLLDGNGVPVNLTGASIDFSMRVKPAGTVKVNLGSATVVDGGGGLVQYAQVSGDVDTADTFETEWKVTYADGTIQRFPNDGYYDTVVTGNIA